MFFANQLDVSHPKRDRPAKPEPARTDLRRKGPMQNQQQMTNKWREVRQKLKEKWNQLSDQDLRSFDGNVEHLIGQIQRKTGESRAAIEHFLDEFMDTLNEEGSEMASQIRETAQQGYEAVRDTYAEAERAVQRRPA